MLRVLLDFGILGFRISKGTWNRRKYRLGRIMTWEGRKVVPDLSFNVTVSRLIFQRRRRFEMSDEPGEEKSSKSITRVQLLLSFFFFDMEIVGNPQLSLFSPRR